MECSNSGPCIIEHKCHNSFSVSVAAWWMGESDGVWTPLVTVCLTDLSLLHWLGWVSITMWYNCPKILLPIGHIGQPQAIYQLQNSNTCLYDKVKVFFYQTDKRNTMKTINSRLNYCCCQLDPKRETYLKEGSKKQSREEKVVLKCNTDKISPATRQHTRQETSQLLFSPSFPRCDICSWKKESGLISFDLE